MDILQERAAHYGPVGPNIRRTAVLWSAYLGLEITPHDVGWLMVLLKASRSKVDPGHLDNYEDARGYVNIAEMMRVSGEVQAARDGGNSDLSNMSARGDSERGA
jgi:hypothetical protein